MAWVKVNTVEGNDILINSDFFSIVERTPDGVVYITDGDEAYYILPKHINDLQQAAIYLNRR
jgi:uncharacterized protein YlzI (FlbEa/FlbD family)